MNRLEELRRRERSDPSRVERHRMTERELDAIDAKRDGRHLAERLLEVVRKRLAELNERKKA
jgi:hypothetical protein